MWFGERAPFADQAEKLSPRGKHRLSIEEFDEMRKQMALLTMVLGMGLGVALAVPTPTSSETKIAALIGKLGSEHFREREAATRELDAIGEPALDALRKASKSTDMETANRAAALVAKIEQRGENARLLAPTYVELTFKDTPVEEAVADLARKSGCIITIAGDKSKLSTRKVTFETGKVPFWKAFEMLCEKAELVEADPGTPLGADVPGVQPVPVPQVAPAIRLRPLQAPVPPAPPVKPVPQKAPPVEKDAPKLNVPEGFSAEVPAQKEAPPVPAQPVQIQVQQLQIQLQQVQAQQLQLVAANRIGAVQPGNNGTIVFVDGKPKAIPTHVEGAIRIRAINNANLLQNFGPIPQGEIPVLLEVNPEPKIQLQQILGVKIDRALDNNDQILEQSLVDIVYGPQADVQHRLAQLKARPAIARPFPGPAATGQNLVLVRLKKGEKFVPTIREMRGTVSLKIRTPVEAIITVDNILKAKGESVKGKGDAQLKIIDVAKEENGDIKVEVELQHSHEIQTLAANGVQAGPQGMVIQGNVQIQIGGGGGIGGGPVIINNGVGGGLGLELQDAKGAALKLMQTRNTKMQWQQNGRNIGAVLVFRPQKDQEAAKLVFKATRPAAVDVPFTLKDVALAE